MSREVIGKALPRVEGVAKVTGICAYAADIRRPEALWGKVLRSSLPHARILNLDVSKAARLPGVKAIITAADMSPKLVGATLRDMPMMARDVVRFVGEELAAVAAADKDTAEEAVSRIKVEYEELPAVFDPIEAMRPEAPVIHPEYASYKGPPTKTPHLRNVQTLVQAAKGEIEKGFAESDHIFEGEYRTQMVHQGYIEPYACTVEADPQGRVAVWVANQAFFKLRRVLSDYLDLPEEMIRIFPSNMGGSFGAKDFLSHVPAAYYLSRMTGKPVKFVRTYTDELMAASPRHPAVVALKVGVKKDGTLWAWEGKTFYNGGAYGAYKPNPKGSMSGAFMVAGSYNIPHTRIEGYCVYTNQVPCGYFRAPGETQTMFAVESHMDMMAESLGLDPLEFRLKNALKEGDTRATGEPLRDPHCVEVLHRVAEISKWLPGSKNRRANGRNGKSAGRGLALGDRHVGHGESSFEISLERDGTLRLLSGVGDQGVGAYTMHRQVVGQTLGVDPEMLTIDVRDTSSAPYDEGIKGARGTHVEGQAAARASLSLIENLRAAAAARWQSAIDDVLWKNGKAVHKKSNKSLALHDLARHSEAPIKGFGHYEGHKPDVYSFQAAVADVEVDGDTGQVTVQRIYFVYDVSTVINPMIHQGQIDGGVVQGLGYGLIEEMIVDQGQVLTLNLGEFKIPNVRDVPPLATSLVKAKEGPGPFGAKAVAEAGVSILGPAIANAVYNAIGVRIKELPVTSEKIVRGLADRGSRKTNPKLETGNSKRIQND
jgi:CO/xanthine dehydrogenase Mo-binding subunit